jgi:hypothetical protein
VDEPTSVQNFRVAPRASYVPLDRPPARFRAGRSGCRGALFLLHYGFVWPDVTLLAACKQVASMPNQIKPKIAGF